MAGMCRSVLIVWSVAATLTAMLGVTAGVSRADDVDLPGVSLTSTSGAPLQAGGTYGIGEVVVAHFDAPVGDRGAAEQQLAVSTSPPVSGAWHWVRPNRALAPAAVLRAGHRRHDHPGPAAADVHHRRLTRINRRRRHQAGQRLRRRRLARTMPTSMGRAVPTRSETKRSASGLSPASTP